MKVLIVTETRTYEVADGEAERLRMLAFMGPLEAIPQNVSRTVSVYEPDEEGFIS